MVSYVVVVVTMWRTGGVVRTRTRAKFWAARGERARNVVSGRGKLPRLRQGGGGTHENGVLQVDRGGQVRKPPYGGDTDRRDGHEPPEGDAEDGAERLLLLAVLVSEAQLAPGAEQLDDGVRPSEPGEDGPERGADPAGAPARARVGQPAKEEVLDAGDERDRERDEAGEDERVQPVGPVRGLDVRDGRVRRSDEQRRALVRRGRRRDGRSRLLLDDVRRLALVAVKLDGGGRLDRALDDRLEDGPAMRIQRCARGQPGCLARSKPQEGERLHLNVSDRTA